MLTLKIISVNIMNMIKRLFKPFSLENYYPVSYSNIYGFSFFWSLLENNYTITYVNVFNGKIKTKKYKGNMTPHSFKKIQSVKDYELKMKGIDFTLPN